MEEVNELKKRVKAFFGGALRAVSERSDYDARSVLRVYDYEDGTYTALLFPNPAMNYELRITGIEEKEDEWIVDTSNKGRWAFRKLSPEALKSFKSVMEGQGFSV